MAHLLKLHRGSEPKPAYVGMIWFDNASNEIKVCTSAPENGKPTWETYGGSSVEIEIADGKNFLNMEDDGLAVRGMETSVTTTTSEIVVAGGPLANNVNESSDSWPAEWKDASGNKKIPAGTSVQELLEKLFNQELFPSAATKPSISITGAESLGLKEVGSTVDIPALSMSKNDGEFNASYSTPEQPPTGVTWSNESMTVGTPTGFTNMSTTGGKTSVAATSGKIVEGTNSVTYNASASYTAPQNSPVTNLGKSANDAAYTFTAGTANATAVSTTATGVYPIYTNGVQLTELDKDSAGAFGQKDQNRLDLVNYIDGGTTYVGFGSGSVKDWIIYVPAGVGISALGYVTTANAFANEVPFTPSETTETLTTSQGLSVKYYKYTYKSTSGRNNIKITLTKS